MTYAHKLIFTLRFNFEDVSCRQMSIVDNKLGCFTAILARDFSPRGYSLLEIKFYTLWQISNMWSPFSVQSKECIWRTLSRLKLVFYNKIEGIGRHSDIYNSEATYTGHIGPASWPVYRTESNRLKRSRKMPRFYDTVATNYVEVIMHLETLLYI